MEATVKSDITARKLRRNIFTIVLLAICLAITTFALIYSMISVDDNLFNTGKVEIDLNGQKRIIDQGLFEPGMTVYKTFYIKNNSTDKGGIYYKLYFDFDPEKTGTSGGGELADKMDVTVEAVTNGKVPIETQPGYEGVINTTTDKNGENIEYQKIYEGKASQLTAKNLAAAKKQDGSPDILAMGETRWFRIGFHFSEDAGNTAQNQVMIFNLAASAVQTKNNPNQEFTIENNTVTQIDGQ